MSRGRSIVERPFDKFGLTHVSNVASLWFVLIWLISTIGMFSLLNIVVGTHYHLPMAAPVALAGAYGLVTLLRYRRRRLFPLPTSQLASEEALQAQAGLPLHNTKLNSRAAAVVILLAIVLAGPHLIGLVGTPNAEGYSSELFHGENTALQVAYPGYREALQWLAKHTHGSARVGLAALPETLGIGSRDISWYYYNRDFAARYHLTEAHPKDKNYPYDYLIWPMHLVQRGFPIPAPWKSHVLHTVSGGNTTYCYITALNTPKTP